MAHSCRQGHVQYHVVSLMMSDDAVAAVQVTVLIEVPASVSKLFCRFWIFYRAYHDGEAFLVRLQNVERLLYGWHS